MNLVILLAGMIWVMYCARKAGHSYLNAFFWNILPIIIFIVLNGISMGLIYVVVLLGFEITTPFIVSVFYIIKIVVLYFIGKTIPAPTEDNVKLIEYLKTPFVITDAAILNRETKQCVNCGSVKPLIVYEASEGMHYHNCVKCRG